MGDIEASTWDGMEANVRSGYGGHHMPWIWRPPHAVEGYSGNKYCGPTHAVDTKVTAWSEYGGHHIKRI
jgi:hypothetical protein